MASARRIELLLTSNVENLGIVGDLVRVRMGFARNFLVPMGLAEVPTPEKIEALAGARVIALEEYEANRTEQAGIIEKLEELEKFEILKNKGLDGWELISMTPFEWETDESGYSYVKEYCYMFKREIK